MRSATSGEVSTANCHPFASSRHLFMHNGQIGGYERLRRRIDALIPDALYPFRKGTSDSEAIFLAALGHDLDRDPVKAFEATIAAILAEAEAAGVACPLRFAAVHSDGETIWAYRWASDRTPPSLYWRLEGGGVAIASEPCDANASGWTAVLPGSALCVSINGSVRLAPFGPKTKIWKAA